MPILSSLPPSPDAFDAEMAAERIRLHQQALMGSMGASFVLGAGMVALLWGDAEPWRLLVWLSCLGAVVLFRLAVGHAGRRAGASAAGSAAWLWRYRAGFLLHGLAWALAAWLLIPAISAEGAQLVVYAIMVVTAGSLVMTVFDLAAATVFIFPALTSMVGLLAARSDMDRTALLLQVAVLHAAGLVAAMRSHAMVRESVRLRLAQTGLIEEARRQADLASEARRELAERNYVLPLLLSATEQGYWLVDACGKTRDVNPSMCRLLGLERPQVLGQEFRDFFSGTDLQILLERHGQRTGDPAGPYEVGILRPDGTRRHCLVHSTQVQDPQGLTVGTIGLWTDITARQAAESSLRTYELAINSISDMVSVVDEDQKYRMVNDAWCRFSGRARADVLGRLADTALPAGVSPRRRMALQECFDQQHRRVVRDSLSLPGLQDRVVETTYYPYLPDGAAVRSVVMVTRDVTAEEQSLALIRDRDAEQRAVLDAFPGFIARVDADLVYSYANDRVATRLGTTPDRMVGRPVSEVVGAEVSAWLTGHLRRTLAGETVTYERHHPRADGADLFDQVTLVRALDPRSGRPVVYSFGVDISDRMRAESALRATSDKLSQATRALQLTLDNIAQGIVSVDADGRVGVYNRRVLELLDLPEYLMGSPWRFDDVVRFQKEQGDLDPDHGFIDIEGQRRYFAGGRVNSPEVYVRRTAKGTVIEVRTRQLEGGGLVRTYADVTAYFDTQQALRDSEAELRTLLDAFPGHIAAAGPAGNYTFVNERHAAVLGLPVNQIVGRPLREVLGEERMRFNERLFQQAREQGAAVLEISYPAAEGRTRVDLEVTYVAAPRRPDGRTSYYGFGVDITARKQAEEALVTARDLAESASRAKSDFLASMSHELRTPLNAILGFSQLFALDPSLPQATRAGAVEIEKAGRHLLALVDDLIDLARIEAGRIDLHMGPVSVQTVLESSADMVQPLALKQGVGLQVDAGAADTMVQADSTRLRQVIINLLSNAIKYNRPGGSVRIACLPDASGICIRVTDTGPGIAADKRDRIFSSFDRLGAERGRVEGAGIGLVITRQLVEAMGGQIGFESTEGVGSTFWVRLARGDQLPSGPAPAATAAPLSPPGPAAGNATLRRPRARVLYVEDNVVNATIMEHILGKLEQVEFLLAETAEAGLAMIRQDPPALVLMDIHLPGMSGVDAVRLLRSDPRTDSLPVYAVSAAAMPGDVQAGMDAGFDGYLTKPFDVEQLLQVVRRVLEA